MSYVVTLLFFYPGCVDNVQILPCTPYLDGSKRSKSSFPVLGTFKRNLYSFGEISDPSNQANKAECLPIGVFNSISWVSHYLNLAVLKCVLFKCISSKHSSYFILSIFKPVRETDFLSHGMQAVFLMKMT